jgi:hypothetical protein
MDYKSLGIISAAVLSVAFLSACNSGSSSDPFAGDSTGSLTLSVTDAPVDGATSVVVVFTGVELRREDAEPVVFTFDEPKQIDLLSLQGGKTETLLDDVEVPAGEYSQIRLMVKANQNESDSFITFEETGGSEFELFIPSGDQTGLKLTGGITVAAGGSADYTLDFDLRKSVTYAPGLDRHILKPTVRILQTDVVGEIAGTIDNALVPEGCSPAVYVYAGADVTPDDEGSDTPPLASALVAIENATAHPYTVAFLEPGDYTVTFTCDADLDNPEANDDGISFEPAQNATVETGETTTVIFLAVP